MKKLSTLLFTLLCATLLTAPVLAKQGDDEQTINLTVNTQSLPSDPTYDCHDIGFETTDAFDFAHYADSSSCTSSNNYDHGPKKFYLVVRGNRALSITGSCTEYFYKKTPIITPTENGTESISVTLSYDSTTQTYEATNCSSFFE